MDVYAGEGIGRGRARVGQKGITAPLGVEDKGA
jgi:hypothetical protein